jgi:hypothetical protein
MDGSYRSERKLAVMTAWGFFGSFGLCFVMSGFGAADIVIGLLGFALVVAGFCAHVLINHLFDTGFTEGEVALGFIVLTASVLSFVAGWIMVADFGIARIAIGLGGFAAVFACLVFYTVKVHGVRGSITLIDEIRKFSGYDASATRDAGR